MVTRQVAALVTVAGLALPVPPAQASHATYDCGFLAVRQDDLTGGHETYVGVAYGYVTSPTPGEAVSVRCTLTVDGTVAASTEPAAGTQAAVSAGQVVFTAAPTDALRLCAVWSAGAESGTDCDEVTRSQVPPQELLDLVDDALSDILDPLLCPVLATVGGSGVGVPGVLEVDVEGDVRLLGRLVVDCPPYDVPREDTGLGILRTYLAYELET